MTLTEQIKNKAIELGFDLVGITDASPIEPAHVAALTDWLKTGCAGQMNYMHRNFEKRINPAELLQDAQSVIVVGLNYKPPPTENLPTPATGRVANYACYEDYHSFIKKQLRKLTDFAASLTDTNTGFKICVDSVPLAERALAARAGLGFIARNHMLINPQFGPQFFLAEVITDLKLETDEPISADCSNCNMCIAACPTSALRPDGRFDAARCISYLTIEHKDQIPPDLALKISNRLFGCDECVLVCPYQKDASVCNNDRFKFYPDRAELDLKEILNLSDDDFDKNFADSCLARSGLDLLKRNARICLDNTRRRST